MRASETVVCPLLPSGRRTGNTPGKSSRPTRILFGHWSTLGLLVRPDVVALDTGCLWGGALTAFRLEDEAVIQLNCEAKRKPN